MSAAVHMTRPGSTRSVLDEAPLWCGRPRRAGVHVTVFRHRATCQRCIRADERYTEDSEHRRTIARLERERRIASGDLVSHSPSYRPSGTLCGEYSEGDDIDSSAVTCPACKGRIVAANNRAENTITPTTQKRQTMSDQNLDIRHDSNDTTDLPAARDEGPAAPPARALTPADELRALQQELRTAKENASRDEVAAINARAAEEIAKIEARRDADIKRAEQRAKAPAALAARAHELARKILGDDMLALIDPPDDEDEDDAGADVEQTNNEKVADTKNAQTRKKAPTNKPAAAKPAKSGSKKASKAASKSLDSDAFDKAVLAAGRTLRKRGDGWVGPTDIIPILAGQDIDTNKDRIGKAHVRLLERGLVECNGKTRPQTRYRFVKAA